MLVLTGLLFALSLYVFAQDATPAPADKAHAPMEMFGMGPEMFCNRGLAWLDAFGALGERAIGKLGVWVLAALALRKTVIGNLDLEKRMDRQGERIDKVALASAPNSDAPVNIDNANVSIQPDSKTHQPATDPPPTDPSIDNLKT